MNKQDPKISVIVPTYNRVRYLKVTLDSIIKNNVSPYLFELLVIDNNSGDSTSEYVAKCQAEHPDHRIRYVIEKNQGASFARNRGIQDAKAPLLLFVDDDEIADANLIQEWISFFERYPSAIGGGGRIEVKFEDPKPEWMSHFLMPLLGEHKPSSEINKYPRSKFPFAGNMAYQKKVFETYGVLKTDLGRKGTELLAGEEKEFYMRIRKHTDQIYHVPSAKVYHRVWAPRMTKTFIRDQAIGLGQSMKLQLENRSYRHVGKAWLKEIAKLFASLPIALFYLLKLNPSKAVMLFKFRLWIWTGYRLSNQTEGVVNA